MTLLTLVADACVLITLGNAGVLQLLTGLDGYRVVTCQRAINEVIKLPASDLVQAAVRQHDILVENISSSDLEELAILERFDARPAFRGRADAEILALGSYRGWIVCSDEAAVRGAAINELGTERVAGTLDLLVWAVRQRRLTVKQAEKLLGKLDIGPELKAKLERTGRSLSELV